MDDDFMSKLALLKMLQGLGEDDGMESENDQGTCGEEEKGFGSTKDLFVSSLLDAYNLLILHQSPLQGRYRRRLVDFIVNPENRVYGEASTYHNFLMRLFETEDYHIAIKVCDFALNLFPFDRSLLADAIRACGEIGQFQLGETYFSRALQIPYEKWDERLFTYGIIFVKNKFDANPNDTDSYNRALDLCTKFIECFPENERGYNQEAEILLLANERDKAIERLYKYITELELEASERQGSALVTAQCCVTLLQILDDTNNYDDIIEIAEYGLRNSTKVQASANIGFFIYRIALAFDAKVHADHFSNRDNVTQALKYYQSAYDLNQEHQEFRHIIEQRYAILRPYAKEFSPLVRRALYVDETKETPSEN